MNYAKQKTKAVYTLKKNDAPCHGAYKFRIYTVNIIYHFTNKADRVRFELFYIRESKRIIKQSTIYLQKVSVLILENQSSASRRNFDKIISCLEHYTRNTKELDHYVFTLINSLYELGEEYNDAEIIKFSVDSYKYLFTDALKFQPKGKFFYKSKI